MVAAAIVGSAVVGGAVSAYGANKAAGAQRDAANQADATQRYMYDQTRADQAPYREAGYGALSRMSTLLGLSGGNENSRYFGSLNRRFTGKDLASDPGYQFGLNQGLDAAQNSAAARGGLYSGATLKALTQFGNDYATTKFDDAFNRDMAQKTSQFNRLASVAGLGQTSLGQVNTAGMNAANNISANQIGAGNARAAGYLSTANAIGNGINQGTAWWLNSGQTNPLTSPNASGAYGNVYGDGAGIDPYGYLGGAGTAGDYSDARLKTDIRRVGTTDEGLPIYIYRYKAGGPYRMGVMAQELEAVDPEAVTYDAHGLRMVDYTKVR